MKISILLAVFSAASFAQAPLIPPSGDLKPDTVVATIEGKDITLADIQDLVAADPRLAQFMQKNPQQALAEAFVIRHLAGEGEKRKLAEQSPLKEQLEAVRAQALAGAMVSMERNSFVVSAEDIEAHFQRTRANYEQARVKAIYLSFRPAPPPPTAGTSPEAVAQAAKDALAAAMQGARSEAEATALANDIVKKLREGADFAKLVEQYSDDAGSKANGGDFGVIKPNSAYPEDVRKAVFALQPGQVTDPIKTGNSLYIMRLEEKVMPPIADVRGEIIETLRGQHLDQFMQGLNARFKPVIKNADFFARPGAFVTPAR